MSKIQGRPSWCVRVAASLLLPLYKFWVSTAEVLRERHNQAQRWPQVEEVEYEVVDDDSGVAKKNKRPHAITFLKFAPRKSANRQKRIGPGKGVIRFTTLSRETAKHIKISVPILLLISLALGGGFLKKSDHQRQGAAANTNITTVTGNDSARSTSSVISPDPVRETFNHLGLGDLYPYGNYIGDYDAGARLHAATDRYFPNWNNLDSSSVGRRFYIGALKANQAINVAASFNGTEDYFKPGNLIYFHNENFGQYDEDCRNLRGVITQVKPKTVGYEVYFLGRYCHASDRPLRHMMQTFERQSDGNFLTAMSGKPVRCLIIDLAALGP